MSTLTDRYIAEVVRRLPENQRDDISSEIAATIDDMVAAELDTPGGHTDASDPSSADVTNSDEDTAERAVLIRLGDPAELAHRYSGSRRYLVGPDVYPVWLRVLRWLMPIAGVIAAVAEGIRYFSLSPEPGLGGLIGEVITAVAFALMWTFTAWTLLVVVIEHSTPEGDRNPLARASSWDPSDLDGPRAGADNRVDAVVSLVLLALLVAVPFVPSTFLYIGHLNDGEPLVNPEIPAGWLAGYLALIGALALIQVWRLTRPGRSRTRLGVEVAVDVIFGAFLTTLVLSQDSVIHPDLVAADAGDTSATVIRWVLIAAIWAIVAWDQVETLRTYRRDAAC